MIEVSVLISTYNRAPRLRTALAALLGQTGDVRYEVIVIDNNSSDDTAGVVAEMAAASPDRIRYVFEGRQGKSHALNTGLTLARGEILAFTDDDVRVAPDWLLQFRQGFDRASRRRLHRWPGAAGMAGAGTTMAQHRALVAAGAAGLRRCLAVCRSGPGGVPRRREHRVSTRRLRAGGGDSPRRSGRTGDGIGSTEDHDLQLRMWRAGMSGLYDPAIVVHADVTADRLTREYHRRWHRGHGHHCALMRLRELVPADLGPMSEPPGIVTLFGTPAYVYLDVPRNAYLCLRSVVLREDPFFYADQLRHVLSYIATGYRQFRSRGRSNSTVELLRFARTYAGKQVDEANCPLKRDRPTNHGTELRLQNCGVEQTAASLMGSGSSAELSARDKNGQTLHRLGKSSGAPPPDDRCGRRRIIGAGRLRHHHRSSAGAQEQIIFPAVNDAQAVLLQKIRNERVRIDVGIWILGDGEIVQTLINKFTIDKVPVRVLGDRAIIFETDPDTR